MPISRRTEFTITNDGRVRIRRSRGSIQVERAVTAAIDQGAREMGAALIADVRRTAEPGVMRRRGYVPGPNGVPMRGGGAPYKGYMLPTERWPVWTGKSRQGFYALVDRTRKTLRIMNRAVSVRGFSYPAVVEKRGKPVLRLFRDRRRKYGGAFGRGWRKAMRRELRRGR